MAALRHNSNVKKSCPPFGARCGANRLRLAIPDKAPEKQSIMHSHDSNQTKLVLARELYDGMAMAISAQRGASEFLEYVLEDLAPEGKDQVRLAVCRAHDRLGLTQ